jgi:SAM-dependent methyltransferase
VSTADLLVRTVPLAQQFADVLCATPNGNDDCGALHGIWPTLRLLQLGADPDRHTTFFDDAIGALAPFSERVLISGCADWGMLATTASIYRRSDAALRATVLDMCVTPLLLCAWYGAQVGLPVRTVCADAAVFDESAAFDVITTHSLMTYGDEVFRRRLVANWHRLLAPGGAVVTVTRLASVAQAPVLPETQEAFTREFESRAAAVTEAAGFDITDAQLSARALRFAGAQISHPVGDSADVRELFESAGFNVTHLHVRRIGDSADGASPVAGSARGGNYAEIVAVKR